MTRLARNIRARGEHAPRGTMVGVDSDALRSRRKRLHADGDHRLCRPNCGEMHLAARDGGALVAAVEAEFAEADPLARQMAVRLAELAGGGGASAVGALRALAALQALVRAQRPASGGRLEELRQRAAAARR